MASSAGCTEYANTERDTEASIADAGGYSKTGAGYANENYSKNTVEILGAECEFSFFSFP